MIATRPSFPSYPSAAEGMSAF